MQAVINVGIVAHVDAGKTTLTEQLLWRCGEIRAPGEVDKGNTQTDWMDFERRRGITARATSTVLHYRDVVINWIDTPGHADFAADVQRSLMALDAAILVMSSVEGIQGQTRAIARALEELQIPVLLVVNKADRAGSDTERVLREAQRVWKTPVWQINEVQAQGTAEVALCEDTPALREGKVLAAAECDDSIAEKYMQGEAIDPSLADETLRAAIAHCRLFPAVLTSAALSLGIDTLLETLCRYYVPAPGDTDAPPLGYVFHLEHDPDMGKIAFVRMFSGRIKSRDVVCVQRTEALEKVTQVRKFASRRCWDVGEVAAGDIAVLCGLSDVRAGDVLGEGELGRSCHLAPPLLSVQVLPRTPDELPRLLQACVELTQEDPSLDYIWLPEQRELHMHIGGTLQIDMLRELFQTRYLLETAFSAPTVIYRETPKCAGTGRGVYTMPKPCWAIVEVKIEPLAPGSGLEFVSLAEDRHILRRYQHHVHVSALRTLQQGLYGWEVTDARVTLVDGENHLVHTHPMDFFVATPMAVMAALEDCGTTLLEPVMEARMTGPEACVSRVIGEMLALRGELGNPAVAEGRFDMSCRVPLVTVQDLPARYSSLTAGKGTLDLSFSGYQPAPAGTQAWTARRSVDPRDRSKWILHCRNAL
ncbi:MAG: TetM/TetW/TetO/TetS family tetracycline resistance ribosomal protection protein [Eubacteriales bacterium]|nr:TetM/TetW/TetO/TetS family tetracycline resistance ribosomal protection protein [Eubacteriales bacterium]